MDRTRTHQLNKGTVLDESYEIISVLGEGGFGITYEAKSIHTGRTVAIKEFFCREYMDRDCGGDGKIILTDGEMGDRFEKEKARFMREGRIIGEFKDEPGVVELVDFFEEGGTAYLVMEYLDGQTLKRYVEEHGRMRPEQLFTEIRPLLRTLDRIHRAGVVHRDISPDNIIRMEDGTMRLIDFGSARNLSSNTQTAGNTYKDGFAPPEQYRPDQPQTPAIDIYSLCATFYYCLTGIRPVSSLHRVLLDELQSPEALGCKLPEEVSDMIERGLSLRPAERQQSVSTLLEVLNRIYPEKKAAGKSGQVSKHRHKVIAAAAVALVILAAAVYQMVTTSTSYRLKTQDTQIVYLYMENMDQIERADWENIIDKRLLAFAGKNNYRLEYNDSEAALVMEFPSKLLHGHDPDEICAKYLICPMTDMKLKSAGRSEGDDTGGAFEKKITADDISEVSAGEGFVPMGGDTEAYMPYVRITLSGEAAAGDAAGRLETRGAEFILVTDAGDPSCWFPCRAEGDGSTVYVIIADSVDEIELNEAQHIEAGDTQEAPVVHAVSGETFRSAFCAETEVPAPADRPVMYSVPSVDWEETEDNILAGRYQMSRDELDGDCMLIVFEPDGGRRPERTAWVNTVLVMKDRLDILRVPYAFGTMTYNDRIAIFAVGSNALRKTEADLLGSGAELYLTDGTDSAAFATDGSPLKFKGGKNVKNRSLEVPLRSGDDLRRLTEFADAAEKRGSDRIYLSIGNDPGRRIAYAKTGDVTAGLADHGKVRMTGLCADGEDITGAEADRYAAFIEEVVNGHISCGMSIKAAYMFDEKGEVMTVGSADAAALEAFSRIRP